MPRDVEGAVSLGVRQALPPAPPRPPRRRRRRRDADRNEASDGGASEALSPLPGVVVGELARAREVAVRSTVTEGEG